MIYTIRERFWSLGGRFDINDEQGAPVFRVVGKTFSLSHKLSFQDLSGVELARIEQQLHAWKQRYKILVDGERFAELVKEWRWFRRTFSLDVPGAEDYTIRGSFWAHEFVFERNGSEVARVSKKAWSLVDHYGVRIEEGENVIAILCACIAIDQILGAEQNAA